ncbi:hypothetical protein Tco_0908731 [Tanacetum coccineum]|uniref:Uncharacterized protein n=1 Tax=Tanacetum coccineum TaxID=301880 RepID=A0ABQ5CRF7_9ASTR
MAAGRVLTTQFQKFIKSRISLDDEDKSIDKRALHKIEYDNRVNERQMQTTEKKVDTSKAFDASLFDTNNSRTKSGKHDTSTSSRNDADADDADMKPVYDEEPMDEKSNEAKVKNDIDVIETINIELEHKVAKLLKENETLKKHYKELYDSIKATRTKTIEQTTSLIAITAEFKAQLQEKGFAIAALKNELRKLKGNSMDTKFAKPSILGKPILQLLRNQSVVRQSTAFKSERPRISKPLFASQVDVKNDLLKPVTPHYLPKVRESSFAKPHHVIASIESRNSLKNMPRFSSNDMVHNHYLEKSRKKQKREILTGHRFSIKKTPVVHEKTFPRSCLRWKPTGIIFKTVGLRWIPIGKIFESSTTKVDSEPSHGSNTDITNLHECIQNLDLIAGTSINVKKEQTLDLSTCTPFYLKKERVKA